MQVHFLFRHMESSEALRSYAQERLEKIKRYFSDPIKVTCVLTVEKIQHVAQFDVTLRNGLQLHASETTENMYSSIDLALAKMERQVRRYKERIKTHKPHQGRSAKVRMGVIAGESTEAPIVSLNDEEPVVTPSRVIDKDEHAPAPILAAANVVRVEEFHADRLTIDQAIMQMNLLHTSFYVFTNAVTGGLNVVFKRDDGNYGLIETTAHELDNVREDARPHGEPA